MVSPRDKMFLGGMGGKVVDTGAEQNVSKPEPTLAQKLMNQHAAALEAKIVMDTLGDQGTKKVEEPITASIVNAAFGMMKDANHEIREEAASKQKQIDVAFQQRDEAKAQSLQVQLGQLMDSQRKLDEALASLKAGAGTSAVSQLREAKELLAEVKKMAGEERQGPTSPVSVGLSAELQITIMKMQQDHDFAMKKMDLEIANSNRDWELKKAEFIDNKEFKQREYEDKVKSRETGMGGFSDILAAVATGLTAERTGIAAPASSAIQAQPPSAAPPVHVEGQEKPPFKAAINKFPCQSCGYPVEITAGETVAKCESCKAEYDITPAAV